LSRPGPSSRSRSVSDGRENERHDDPTQLATSADYTDAVATAVAASAAYYTDGSTPLGDDEYDALLQAISANT
jgi:hypothetical protein